MTTIFPALPAGAKEEEKLSAPKRIGGFLLSFIQLCALLFIIRKFNIEQGSGISSIVPVILIAFALSSFVPLRFRPTLLFAASVTVIYYAFGLFSGSLLLLGGLTLLACCHLPIKFWLRVAIILLIAIGMVIVRIDLLFVPRAALVVPFLASMFMFRLIVYLYEIKHGTTPATWWQRISYFFLFPNHCFLLFPIIDYKTYLRNYYSGPDAELWQKGIRWMLRGIVHLIGYRIIYYHLLISPSEVTDLLTLLQYMCCSYALILRLSGLFHLVLGLLCLFGFNLHPIFNNPLLATSFVDMWRRINIYWREFIMKVFFYPLMFRIKKKIPERTVLPVTMMIVFVLTWALHNYQWFWLRGYFPLTAPDILFWGVIGICITINAMLQEKELQKPRRQIRPVILYPRTMLKMAGIFLFMSVMWSLWSSSSVNEWLFLLTKGTHADAADLFWIGIIILAVIAAGTFVQHLISKERIKKIMTLAPQHTLWLTLPSIIVLSALALPATRQHLPAGIQRFVSSVADEQLNTNDRQARERGYYKMLIDGETNSATGLWEIHLKRPHGFASLDEVYKRDPGLLRRTFRPNAETKAGNYVLKTNSMGMRDKEYTLSRPANTFRIALMGGSYEAGAGVNNQEIFESLAEEKLNQSNTDSIYQKFEILNFAVPGYHLVQHAELVHTRIFEVQPQAVIYVAHSGENWRLLGFIADLIKTGADLKYDFLKDIKKQSGAKQSMSDIEIKERLEPYIDGIIRWSYIQIATETRKHNAVPVWAYLPTTADVIDMEEFERIRGYAEKLGFVIMDLRGAYGDVDRKTIAVSEYDTHPNAKGHRLIAEKFYSELMKKKNLILYQEK